MDKLLLTAFLSSLAGFLTAVLSIVKLINEKESKTTDYRQAWTDSARKSLADLIGLIRAQVGHEILRMTCQETLASALTEISKINEADSNYKGFSKIADLSESRARELSIISRETFEEIYKNYSFVRLHFKPNDISFNRIEQKFDVAIKYLDDLKDIQDKDKRIDVQGKINAIANDMTSYARDILKTEWETVKTGEPAYKKTKKWSIWGGVLMLFILISIGIHAFLDMSRHTGNEKTLSSNSCYKIDKQLAASASIAAKECISEN